MYNDYVSVIMLSNLVQPYRFQHTYIIGKTGTGKSTLLKQFILDDISDGSGVLFVDPHGSDANEIIERIPDKRKKDVIVFDPSDLEFPISWNLLENVDLDRRPFVANSIVDCFRSINKYDEISPTYFTKTLYSAVAALLDMPDGTLLGIKYLLISEEYRRRVLPYITDPVVRRFWSREYPNMDERQREGQIQSTECTFHNLMSDPVIRNCLGQSKSAFTFADALKDGKIIIARLPKGRLGEGKVKVLGSLLLAGLNADALARDDSRPFHVYLDEMHHFDTSTLREMLSGIRKFNVSLTLCHQYLDQISVKLRDAVLGNVGTKFCFRVGITDSAWLSDEFGEDGYFNPPHTLEPYEVDIVSPCGRNVLRTSPLTYSPKKHTYTNIINNCRKRYGSQRDIVEKKIANFISST